MYIRTGEGATQGALRYTLGDAPPSAREAEQRFKRVAALVTDGLKLAKAAVPQLKTQAQQDLLRFMTSLLDNFFPSGHGLVDAQGKVLRQSQKGTIQINVRANDGSLWPFEHRVGLYLVDQVPDPRVRGELMTGIFSSIRLFTREMDDRAPGAAARTSVHEMTHMMFAMIRRFEQRFGAETAARLLSRQPWRLLVLSGFETHRQRLERHVRDLLRVLPIPMQPGDLAASLIEEAFAFTFGVILDEAIARSSRVAKPKRGPAILVSADFPPKEFLRFYVLERGFSVTEKQLDSREAGQIFHRMTGDVEALAAALRAHLDR
jgi:hypothetical protein